MSDEAVWRVLRGHLRSHLTRPPVRAVCGRAELVERPQTGVGNDRVEPVGVSGNPVRHVSAERATHRGGAGAVDAGMRACRISGRDQISVRRETPCAPATLDEVLAVSGGQRGIRQQHRVALRDEQPRIPPPVPRVPAGQRTAVHPQHQAAPDRRRPASASHERTARPSGAVAVTSVSVPGSLGDSTARQRGDGAVGVDAHRVRRGGVGTAQREDHTASGAACTSVYV